MKRLILGGTVFAVVAALFAVPVGAQSSALGFASVLFGLQLCKGPYALCAASTCTPTGGTIVVNTARGTNTFPAASCTCPIFNGLAIADVTGGNMKGSCDRPGPGQVWSLYAPKSHIPQAVNNWSRKPAESAVSFQLCSSSDNVGSTFVNCFSFACTVDRQRQNGVKTATCICPLGENLDGEPVSADTAVVTPAGQCNSSFCTQHPVGAPVAGLNGQPNQCLGSQ
jgi:hypothetical protein